MVSWPPVPKARPGSRMSLTRSELGRFLGESLRVAAGEDGDGAGVLAFGPAEPLAALLVAEVGDGAAVHHKDVGLFALRHDGETGV